MLCKIVLSLALLNGLDALNDFPDHLTMVRYGSSGRPQLLLRIDEPDSLLEPSPQTDTWMDYAMNKFGHFLDDMEHPTVACLEKSIVVGRVKPAFDGLVLPSVAYFRWAYFDDANLVGASKKAVELLMRSPKILTALRIDGKPEDVYQAKLRGTTQFLDAYIEPVGIAAGPTNFKPSVIEYDAAYKVPAAGEAAMASTLGIMKLDSLTTAYGVLSSTEGRGKKVAIAALKPSAESVAINTTVIKELFKKGNLFNAWEQTDAKEAAALFVPRVHLIRDLASAEFLPVDKVADVTFSLFGMKDFTLNEPAVTEAGKATLRAAVRAQFQAAALNGVEILILEPFGETSPIAAQWVPEVVEAYKEAAAAFDKVIPIMIMAAPSDLYHGFFMEALKEALGLAPKKMSAPEAKPKAPLPNKKPRKYARRHRSSSSSSDDDHSYHRGGSASSSSDDEPSVVKHSEPVTEAVPPCPTPVAATESSASTIGSTLALAVTGLMAMLF